MRISFPVANFSASASLRMKIVNLFPQLKETYNVSFIDSVPMVKITPTREALCYKPVDYELGRTTGKTETIASS